MESATTAAVARKSLFMALLEYHFGVFHLGSPVSSTGLSAQGNGRARVSCGCFFPPPGDHGGWKLQ